MAVPGHHALHMRVDGAFVGSSVHHAPRLSRCERHTDRAVCVAVSSPTLWYVYRSYFGVRLHKLDATLDTMHSCGFIIAHSIMALEM